MRRLLGPLRVRLALAGFAAIYLPVIILIIVIGATERFVDVDVNQTITTTEDVSQINWVIVGTTAVVLAPIAAALAWWWAGRAVRPVEEAIAIQERLIEETSHELRTPLAVLTNNAEVLLSHPEPSVEIYRNGLQRSQAVAERMSATLDGLLVDARGRARTIERLPTDVGRLVDQVVQDLQPLANRRSVVLDIQSSASVQARVDGPSIERALTNLITNALQASPPGTAVDVTLGQDQQAFTVAVTDRGPGIVEADQARVFDRYWHGESDGHASAGIGLAIVRHVALAHGGDVTLCSPVQGGEGSEFRFTAPL